MDVRPLGRSLAILSADRHALRSVLGATLQFEGTRIVAIPGDGYPTWRSEVGSVPSEAFVALLEPFRTTPPFLFQQEIDRLLARGHAARIALDRIVELIREAPDAVPNRELRHFLWSRFTGHHLLNLWRSDSWR